MPDAGELFSGFWDGAASPVIDALAAAYTFVSDAVVGQSTSPSTHVTTLRSDQVTPTAAPTGRPVVTYPCPVRAPSWGALSATGVTQVLARGVDFEADPSSNAWTFDADPLLPAPARTVWTAGTPIGVTDLWYGLPAVPPAPVPYPDGSYGALVTAAAAACASPCAQGNETVEALTSGPNGPIVVTTAAVYQLGAGDAPTVAVGQALAFGQPLGGAWALTKLGPGLPALPYLTLPPALFQGATAGPITFYNTLVSTVVDTSGGRTRVRWRLGAQSQADLDAFWAASHTNGVANGFTLAQALDTRTAPTTEPTAATLPAYVNPLLLVCRELLAGNAWLLVTNPAAFGAGAPGPAPVQAAAGPYTAVFVSTGPQAALTPYDPS